MSNVEEILGDALETTQAATHPASEWAILSGISDRWKENRDANAKFIEEVGNPEFVLKLINAIQLLDEVIGELIEEYVDEQDAEELFRDYDTRLIGIFAPEHLGDKH